MHDSTCSIAGCAMKVKCGGWCQTHYRRHLKYGDPLWKPSCGECGAKFDRTHPRQKFCTPECYRRKEWKRLGLMVDPLTLACANEGCSESFTQKRQYQKYCSPDCASRAAYVKRSADAEWVAARAAYNAEYASANREALRAKSAEWREANRDRIAEMNRSWRARNPLRQSVQAREWRIRNREKRSATEARRVDRKRSSAIARITPADLQAKSDYWGNRCWICGGDPDTWDHVKPLAKGGPHILANLRPACRRCNSSKNAKWEGPRAA